MKESFPPDNTQHPQQWSINSLQPPPLSNTSRHHSSSLPLIRFTAVCQDNKAIVYPLIIQRAIHSPGSQTDPSTQIYDTYTSSMHFILFLIYNMQNVFILEIPNVSSKIFPTACINRFHTYITNKIFTHTPSRQTC